MMEKLRKRVLGKCPCSFKSQFEAASITDKRQEVDLLVDHLYVTCSEKVVPQTMRSHLLAQESFGSIQASRS